MLRTADVATLRHREIFELDMHLLWEFRQTITKLEQQNKVEEIKTNAEVGQTYLQLGR